ncbi:MAG: hypothetical protein R2867_14225 [Caldilineaceae bacterium]
MTSTDSVICAVTGLVVGVLAWQFLRSWNLLLELVLGVVGGVIGGSIANGLDIMNVGDYADPIIAGTIGALLFVGVATLFHNR